MIWLRIYGDSISNFCMRTSKNMITSIGALSSLFFTLIFSCGTLVYGDNVNPGVFSKDSEPFGIPYNEWLAKWLQWNIGIPEDEHPRFSYMPEKCAVDQNGPVWFLSDLGASGKEVRSCTIPSGKAILFPILSGQCDYGLKEVNKNDDKLIECAKKGNDFSTVAASVNGNELRNLKDYRATSGFFNITIPRDNIFEADPGTFRSIVDGYFVFLEPLPPGKHEIKFYDRVLNPIELGYNHEKEVTYFITVEG
jgi:hypothetical protein